MASSANASRKSARSFWTPLRVVLTLVVFGLLAALGISSCNSGETPNSNSPANKVVTVAPANAPPTAPAPAFVALPQSLRDTKVQTLDGESLKLSDFADKVVIVNVWAVWCGPCRLEMPELIKMSNEYKSRGLVVIGLATSYQEDRPHVEEYVHSQKIPYKIVFDDGTLQAPLVEAVHGQSVIPQSFVISRDGRIIRHFEGFSQYSTPMLMRQAVEDALNGKA